MTEVGRLKICETRAEGCHAKLWGLCERTPAVTSNFLSISGHFMPIQTMRHSPRSRQMAGCGNLNFLSARHAHKVVHIPGARVAGFLAHTA